MKLATAIVAVAFVVANPLHAADKHGGHEVEVGKYHVELVVKEGDLSLYVRDQADKPVNAKTVKANANVLSGKDRGTVQLAPGADEGLSGQVPFSVAKNAKVIVTFSVAGAKSEQARFSLGQKQKHQGHGH